MRRILLVTSVVAVLAACGARTPPGDLLGGSPPADAGASSSSGGSSSGGSLFGDASRPPTVDSGTTPPKSCTGIPPAGHGGGGTPEVLAQLAAPAAIAVDANALYVASYHAGPVSRVALDGSGASTLDAVGSYNVAINSTSVFTPGITGVVASCNKAGCGGVFTTLASDELGVWAVAADESNVYFTSTNGVQSVPIGGGAPATLRSPQTGPGNPDSATWLALRDGRLYFGMPGGNYPSLGSVGVDGGAPVTLATLDIWQHVAALTVDCTSVYYGLDDGTLTSIPIDGGTPTMLATGQLTSLQLAVDQSDLYFTASTAHDVQPGEQPTGYLRSVPIAGGAVRTLATFPGAPGGVALDASYVYWANSTDGTVSRMTK